MGMRAVPRNCRKNRRLGDARPKSEYIAGSYSRELNTEIVSRTNGSSEQSLAGPRRQQPPQRRESFGRGALLAPRLDSRGRHLGELLMT